MPEKKLRFPHRRSVGTLYIAPESQPEEWELLSQVRGLIVAPENQPIKWEWLEEARGTVTIPPGQKLKLKISGVGSGSLAFLSDLQPTDVHTLDLSGSEVSDVSLSHLDCVTGLTVLELTSTGITDAGLQHLSSLVNLHGLGLSYCHISGKSLMHFKKMTKLKELWMSGAEIYDDELSNIEHLTELVQLGLSGTKLTDASIEHLAKLKSLMRIYLFNTAVTAQGPERLRQKLSRCRVKWKPHGSDDISMAAGTGMGISDLFEGLSPNVMSIMKTKLDDEVAPTPAAQPMSDEQFWEIIDLLQWEKLGDDAEVIEDAVQKLATRPQKEIIAFADILSEKLHVLDGEIYAREIGADAYTGPEQDFSQNCFLRARCCVIANGKEWYEEILGDPKRMPKDMEFESLLKIAPRAYERKTGMKLSHTTKYNYQTFANKNGWVRK